MTVSKEQIDALKRIQALFETFNVMYENNENFTKDLTLCEEILKSSECYDDIIDFDSRILDNKFNIQELIEEIEKVK